jgi:AraC family L-rhamnose operon regulatory protein RhaS
LELEQSILHQEETMDLHEPKGNETIQFVTQTLRERSQENWTLDSMATLAGYGRTQFATLVKKMTGDTPVMLINRIKIEKAAQDLRDSNESVTKISLKYGFSSSQYFSSVFKEYLGTTPSTYRKNNRL